MSDPELDSVQAILNSSFDLGNLSASFQPLNSSGTSDNCKQLVIFNGSTVGVDISYDGVNKHDFWPSGATIVLDFQTNHSNNPPYGSGTKYLRSGQIIWGRTSTTSTFLQISGYR